MENTLKRLFSLAIAVIMVISLMPLNGLQVYAAEVDPDAAQTESQTESTPSEPAAEPEVQSEPETQTESEPQASEPAQQAEGSVTLTGIISETATGNIENSWCPACEKEVTWVPIPHSTSTDKSSAEYQAAQLPVVQKGEEYHYYVPQNRDPETNEIMGVTNNTKNINSQDTTNPTGGNSYFFLYLFGNGKVCLHLNGSKLTTANNAHMASGTLNVMGAGEWTGNYSGNGRGTTIHHHGSYGYINLYSGTFKSGVTGKTAVSYGAGNMNSYSGMAQINIYDPVRIESDLLCRSGVTTMYGGTLTGRVIVAAYSTTAGYLPTFTYEGGTILGGEYDTTMTEADITKDGGYFFVKGGRLNLNGGTWTGKGTDNEPWEHSGGVIYADKSTYQATTVNIRNATITGGVVKGNGGAVSVAATGGTKAAVLNIYSSTISGGKALPLEDGTLGLGGNIHSASGTTAINSADGTTTISGGNARVGGNIYIGAATLTVKTGTKVLNGTATGSGGNIYNAWKMTVEKDTTISDGTAAQNGGNIYYADSTAATYNLTTPNYNAFNLSGTITRGTATNGDGGNIYSASEDMNVNILAGEVSHGTAGGSGGNIYAAAGTGIVNIGNDTGDTALVTEGTATDGGCIYANHVTVKATGTVSNGEATTIGGNIRVPSGTTTFNIYGKVTGGEAGTYGGNIVTGKGTGTITGEVSDGTATTYGGNIATAGGGLLTIDGGKILRGKAGTNGGNINSNNGAILVKNNGLIDGGIADYDNDATGVGGNIRIFGGGDTGLTLESGTISNGTTTQQGGNIYVYSSDSPNFGKLIVTGGKIIDGEGDQGGNIYATSANTVVTISGGEITGGTAMSESTSGYLGGGNITINGSAKATITNATISGGTAIAGGNIMVQSGTVLTLGEGAQVLDGEATGDTSLPGGGNIQTSTGTININPGAVVSGGTAKNGKGSNVGAIYGGTINLNGGTIGSDAEKDTTTVRLYTGNAKNTNLTVNDGTLYGKIYTSTYSTGALTVNIYHGQFSEEPVAKESGNTTVAIQGGATVKMQNNGLYGVHVLGEGKENPAATCTGAGAMDWTCTYTYKVNETDETAVTCNGFTEPLDALGHSPEKQDGQAATCTEDGWNDYWYCSVCEKYFSDEACEDEIENIDTWKTGDGKISALGHTEEKVSGQAATCTEDGWNDYYQCSVCKKYFSDEECTVEITDLGSWKTGDGKLGKLGHDYEGVVTAPTCEEKGYTTYTCKNDPSHTYVDNYVDALEHNYVGEVTKDPTCTEKGVMTYTCKNDPSHTYTEEIPALDHKWNEGVITKAPACGVAGEKTYTCENDNSHTYTESVAALEHIAGEEKKENEVPATETTDGSYDLVVRCTVCNEVLESEHKVVPATGVKVAQVGTTTYFSIANAIAAIEEAGTITMIADYEITEALATNGKDITIDLGGKALTVSAEITVNEGDSLTVMGEGKLLVDKAVKVQGVLDVSALGYGYSGLANNRPGSLAIAATGTVKLMNAWTGYSVSWLNANSAAFFAGSEAGAKAVLGDKTYVLSTDWLLEGAVATVAKTLAGVAYTESYATLTDAAADATAGQTVKVIANTETAPVMFAEDVVVDFNGYSVKGTVLGTIRTNGGLLITAENYKMFGVGADYYETDDAVLFMDAQGTIKIVSGEVTLVPNEWWTDVNQTLIIGQDAKFIIGAGKVMQVRSSITVLGEVEVAGSVNLYEADATITADANLNVTTSVADSKVEYVDGVYKVVAKNYVAQIGEQGYETLEEAIAAGGEVVLLKDIEITTSIRLSNTVTVDLNGKKLTGPDDGKANWYAFIVDGGDLTLKDSVGGGELYAKCFGVETKSGSFTMESGKINATKNGGIGAAVVNYGGTVTINGGELIGAVDAVCTGGYFAVAETVIKGGTLTGPVTIAEEYNSKGSTVSSTNTYETDPDYKWVEQDGVYVLTAKDYVAQIGEQGYETLEEAIAAGGEVVLLKDIEITTSIRLSNTVTVDLNGKKLTGPDDGKANWYAFIVDGGDLTLKDSVGGGELYAKCFGVETKSGSFTMESGKINATKNGGIGAAVVNYGGTVTINGGELIGAVDAVCTGGYFAVAETVIKGGTLTGPVTIAEEYNSKGSTVSSTSTYETDPDYKWVEQDGVYVLTAKDYVAQIEGGAKYESLTDAVAAAEDSDTIVLLKDIVITDENGVEFTKNITVDLNGQNITSVGEVFVVTAGKLTIEGDGEVTGNNDNHKTGGAVWAKGGEVEIYGGTYSTGYDDEGIDALDHSNDTIYTSLGGKITIYGGTFIKTEHVWVLNENKDNKETLTVYGGTFVGFDPTAANDADEYYLADSFHAVLDGENYVVEEHTAQHVAAQAADCTNAGNTEYWICDDCGKYYSDEAMTTEIEKDSWVVDALGHDYESVVTAPTCEDDGYTTYTCSACGDTYVDDYVDALGHDYTSEVTTAPTCEDKGVRTYTCKNDPKHTYTEDIAALGHDYESVVTAPTCEAEGYTTYTCKNDPAHTYVADQVAALGHDYTSEVTTAPTCEDKGVRTYTCKNDPKHTYTEEIAALGHTAGTPVVEQHIAATETTDGCEDIVTYCSVCGTFEMNRVHNVIPALGVDVAYNEQTGEYYKSVAAALAAATEGQTVKVHAETEEDHIMVPAGVTLDLNGKTLTVGSAASFGTIMGDGKLAVGEYDLAMPANNGKYLPAYENGGYVFKEIYLWAYEDGFVGEEYVIKFAEYKNRDYFKNYIKLGTGKFDVIVRASWITGAGDNAVQDFIFGDGYMTDYADRGAGFTFEISGAQDKTDFDVEVLFTYKVGNYVVEVSNNVATSDVVDGSKVESIKNATPVAKHEEVEYYSVSEALAAATSGEVTVIAPSTEASIMVPAGVTLNLNGQTLTVGSAVSFGTIMGDGKLAVGEYDLAMPANNGKYLPAYENGGYVFKEIYLWAYEDGFVGEEYVIKFAEYKNRDYFKNYIKLGTGKFDVIVRASWITGAGDNAVQDFIFGDGYMTDYADRGAGFTFEISGAQDKTDFDVEVLFTYKVGNYVVEVSNN